MLCSDAQNSPITRLPGGPVDKPVNEIAQRLGATADQVLLAWVRAKGAVAVTYAN
jgi:aryl-alcohol dehydrogenase-like predicted oxidoreductase